MEHYHRLRAVGLEYHKDLYFHQLLFNVHIEDLDGCVPQHLETSTNKYAKAWPYCSGRVSNSTISYSWQYCSSEIVFKKTA